MGRQNGAPGPVFEGRKGLGVVRTFMFPKRHLAAPNRYDVDPYTPRWSAEMPPSRLAEIKSAGFDFIRIAIDPGPLFEADGETFDRRIREIKEAIDSSLQQNLKVLIDLHVELRHPLWGFRLVTAGFDTTAFQRYMETVRALANVISSYDARLVALELFNEPPPPCEWKGRPDWPTQLAVIYKEARRIAPEHTLLVAGSCWASIEGLLRLDGANFDHNTMFVFHYYDPSTFTFQGYWGYAKYVQYTPRLPYPPDPAQLDENLSRVKETIQTASDLPDKDRDQQLTLATKALQDYFMMSHGKNDVEKAFGKVASWAEKYNISSRRIILGEFGVMKDVFGHRGASPEDRARWLKDVVTTADEFGFAWSAWVLSGTMGIVTGDIDGPLDARVLRALGLRNP